MVNIKVNKITGKKYGPLEESIYTCIQTYHHGVTQKMIVKAREGKGIGNKQF